MNRRSRASEQRTVAAAPAATVALTAAVAQTASAENETPSPKPKPYQTVFGKIVTEIKKTKKKTWEMLTN